MPRNPRSVLTIGTFDGVHHGHRRIISSLVEQARSIDGRAVVITFDPHPQEVLRRHGDSVPVLTTLDERAEELESLGVDALLVLGFTQDVADTPWTEFISMLIEQLGMVHIVVGHDHAFGRNREGNADSLRELGATRGFGVTEIGPLVVNAETVSSTKIRRALLSGHPETAATYMGRPYSIDGTVMRGDGRGRTLGIPTANIRPTDPAKLVPSNGVYCVTLVAKGVRHKGMANIGTRPTFTDGTQTTIEVHIFDFDEDIYNNIVRVEFRRFVRSERTFGSVEEFLEQIERDRMGCT